MSSLRLASPCKINLILNILGRRTDGFHELETIFQPVPICDELHFQTTPAGVQLTCSNPELPVDSRNLVHRAASAFFAAHPGAAHGVQIHLVKHLPLAAGLGGGSANAAITLRGLNELFGKPLAAEKLQELAARLGSDVPFFLQDNPALATGRGELVQPLPPFPALKNAGLLLVHPGFGVSTPWAYQQLAKHPNALNGQPGRAAALADVLQTGTLSAVAPLLYNSLEAPAFVKYPLLPLIKDFFLANGAVAALMSGSGSTLFALAPNIGAAQSLDLQYRQRFGPAGWSCTALL
ncbi:MAG: 4-(cytidine 5'-diphospho)-2-C-methyl-D-erythritol kinase [Pedosphaera sp.]|nr:4-(cytidine 5'-diphospho)-2-C-methyl-D-erythritol kinase [Pedosphaera sp.]MSU42561.1 4-(cytidine 5'-diphospho)-2-C-methyl-D-erythritol kinase [Pedosphaera sp.]